ncbi:DUF4998 domain-containing protein [Pedobacter nyackensis]|uniref:DUF4998 domain-containing protein n=1 Tax=Pedobacter nyackensis TaxID=475255 RepID=UPI002930EAA2|nr:DUF4998 domain-containing protein [Pedobacter nyackensis]
MKEFNKSIYIYSTIAALSILSGCGKLDTEFKKYTQEKELIYPGTPAGMSAYSGYKRVQFNWNPSSDPTVHKYVVYWNNNNDSTAFVIPEGQRESFKSAIVKNVNEGTHFFTIHTYDKQNNRSVPIYVSNIRVYGDYYLKALSNRSIKTLGYSLDASKIIIDWNAAIDGEKTIELKYTDEAGATQTIIVPGGALKTEISGYKKDTKLTYRSIYLPEPSAIDEFSVDYTEVVLPKFERQLDKSKFNQYVLPTDARDAWGWLMSYLWNDDYGTPGFATTNGIPQWFTFDMGESVSISKFKTWQASDRIYRAENVKKFEIWGSNNPASDGSWTGWEKLGDCQSVKPSGLPLGETTAGDINYAKAGEEFKFPGGTPKVRYIRIKVLETWGNGSFITMGELSFWTTD